MKLRWFILLAAIMACRCADGQVVLTLTGPAKVNAGQAATLSLSIGGTPDCGCSAAQWQINLPAGWSIGGLVGPSGVAAQKSLYSSATGAIGLTAAKNTTIIPNGVCALFTLAIPPDATPGNVTLALSGMFAASPNGFSIPVVSGPAYVLSVLPRYDLNGDGKFDVLDIQFLVSVMLAAGPVLKP